MSKIKTAPPTEKQKEAMSYTEDIAYHLADPETAHRIRDLFDILIHRIPDEELDRPIEIFKEIEKETLNEE